MRIHNPSITELCPYVPPSFIHCLYLNIAVSVIYICRDPAKFRNGCYLLLSRQHISTQGNYKQTEEGKLSEKKVLMSTRQPMLNVYCIQYNHGVCSPTILEEMPIIRISLKMCQTWGNITVPQPDLK